ncbi:MAG: FAD-dependent oxidoreductase [Oleispira sp.]
MKSSVSDSSSGQKIAILGGGLAGRLLAWRLASRRNDQNSTIDNGINTNTEIHIFEKGRLRPDLYESDKAAAFTAAAMISPLSELVASELEIYKLGQASLALWPTWLEQLDCLQHFHQHGSLVLAHPNDLAELRQFQRDLDFKLQQLPNEHSHPHSLYQDLQGQDQVAVFEPQIAAHFKQGLFLQGEAHIDHHEVLAQLVQQAQALGVQYHQNQALEVNDPALAEFDLIFDCRGMGSNKTDKTLRGVRGEVIWLESKEIILSRPIRLMHPRYKLYVVPKPNHQFIIGATEIESEDRSPISLRSSMELMSALYAINPAFAEARIIAQDCNLRPAYIDNLPQIEQRISALDQPIISINGLYRHGYLIGPAIIEQAIEKAFL